MNANSQNGIKDAVLKIPFWIWAGFLAFCFVTKIASYFK